MKNLIISDPARSDLEVIAAFTETHWGEAKKTEYLKRIKARFQAIRANPHHGMRRDEIRHGYRSVPEGRHVIFYRESKTAVEILRVLHQRMEPARHLTKENP